jgi:hypothetical protein
MGGLAHVERVDGRLIGDGNQGPVTRQLKAAYADRIELTGIPID